MGGWYSMNKKGDNKIGIPWYKRNIQFDGGDDMGAINPISFDLPDGKRNRNRQRQRQRQRVRETVPQTQTETEPATSPSTQIQYQPDIGTNPFKVPLGFPMKKPNDQANPSPAPAPAPAPAFPMIPAYISDPNFNWAKHFEEISKNLPKAAPEPPKLSPAQKVAQNIITPILGLFIAHKVASDYVKVKVTDPIYNQMLKDPVLGTVLREGEKANLDAATLGTILANFDWENGDYKQLEKTLAVSIGVAGAARLMVFIIGRKVLFRV